MLLQYVTKSNSVDEPGIQYKDRDQLAIRESSFSQNTWDLPLIQTPILVSFSGRILQKKNCYYKQLLTFNGDNFLSAYFTYVAMLEIKGEVFLITL